MDCFDDFLCCVQCIIWSVNWVEQDDEFVICEVGDGVGVVYGMLQVVCDFYQYSIVGGVVVGVVDVFEVIYVQIQYVQWCGQMLMVFQCGVQVFVEFVVVWQVGECIKVCYV